MRQGAEDPGANMPDRICEMMCQTPPTGDILYPEVLMKTLLVVTVALCFPAFLVAQNQSSPAYQRLVKEVRHELVMLPYLGVFDNLEFKVDGSTVTLMGQVVRPTLKTEAENVVKKIEGVEKVSNQIEVLPLSPNDDGIRRAVYMALARSPQLDRYFMQAVAPIRIIVKNGNVTLEGVVANKGDSEMANIAANQVSGVFSVTNHLRVEK
jgi:hyperosmotically inducible protein